LSRCKIKIKEKNIYIERNIEKKKRLKKRKKRLKKKKRSKIRKKTKTEENIQEKKIEDKEKGLKIEETFLLVHAHPALYHFFAI